MFIVGFVAGIFSIVVGKVIYNKRKNKNADTLLEGLLIYSKEEKQAIIEIVEAYKAMVPYQTEEVAKRNATDVIASHLKELIDEDNLNEYGEMKFIKECSRLVETLWVKEYKETFIEKLLSFYRNKYSKQ